MARILEFRRTGEDRDPMEEPGTGYCADCGMYPLRERERHDCQP